MELLEVFKDFEVVMRGKSGMGKYDALYKLVPVNPPKPVTLDDLARYVEGLQQRFPDRGFYLGAVKVGEKRYFVVTKKSWMRSPDGTRKRVHDRVPVYVDLEGQKFYVPKSYVKKKYKLACYVLMRVLGSLGVAKVKYLSMLR